MIRLLSVTLVLMMAAFIPRSYAQDILDDGLRIALDGNLNLVEKGVQPQSSLGGSAAKCYDFGQSTVARVYAGRIRVGNKDNGTKADENGGTKNLCLPIGLPASINTRLAALGITQVPTVSAQQQITKRESNLDVKCSTNKFIINYRHSGDENGNSTYECGRVKVGKGWEVKWGSPSSRARVRQSKVGPFGCANTVGLLMRRAEHYGDENGYTYFTCTVPTITAPYTGANGLFSSQGVQVATALFPIFAENSYKDLLATALEATTTAEALDLIKLINTDTDLAALPGVWQAPFSTDLLTIYGSPTTNALFDQKFGVTDLTSLKNATAALKAMQTNWSASHQTLRNAAQAVGLGSVNALLYGSYPVPTLGSLQQLIADYSTPNAQTAITGLLGGNLVAACAVPRASLPLLLQQKLIASCV